MRFFGSQLTTAVATGNKTLGDDHNDGDDS